MKDFAKWCGEHLKHNYILKSKQEEILSGGTTNNKKDWWRPHRSIHIIEYELKCYEQDAILVKLTWM